MKNIVTVKLGTVCRDKATELEGTVTHWICDMDHRIDYLFQPRQLNPEDGQPVRKIFLAPSRLENIPESAFEEVVVPVEILGTIVSDKGSGFTGMAISFTRHINGCFHVDIQPTGVLKKNNSHIKPCNFDLRECEGEKITEMSSAALAKSRETNPSPTGDDIDSLRSRSWEKSE